MKKELTKDKQWLKISAICIAVYLLIAIPLTIWIDCITWHWFWFGFFVVYIPLAFFYMYFWSEKRKKPNEEQKKTATLNIFKYILLFWFYDLLYMAIFNQWLVLEYIFGIIAVIIIFSNLIKAFLSGIKAFKWMLPFDLLFGVGLSVYLIYRMPNETLQTIVLTIVAALYGGLLTLVGVAWTIKKADNDRKEENRGKARPFFGIIDTDNFKSEVSSKLEIGFRPKEFNKLNYYKEINIENSDKVPFFIEKFVIGEREYYPDSTLLISKGMMCALVIYEEDDKKTNINKFYLYLTDINYEQRKYEIEDLGSCRYTIKEI